MNAFPSTIGIIGYGQFGRFLEVLVRTYVPHVSSANIYIADRGDALQRACSADIVFLCVPISAYADTVQAIRPHLGALSVVCDVATVKVHTVRALREAGIQNYIATHPMFGPYSYEKHGKSLSSLRIALCGSTLTPAMHAAAVSFLRNTGLIVLEMSPEEHDMLIAETLFLTHLVGQTVHQGGFERTSIDTVSFGYLMDAVESVAQDEALFRDVYRFNPYCDVVLARVESVQRNIAASLRKATGPGFPEPAITG